MSMDIIISNEETWMSPTPEYLVIADAIKEHLNNNDPLDREISIMLEEATVFLDLSELPVELFCHFCKIYKEAFEKYPDSDAGIYVKNNGDFPYVMSILEAFLKRLEADPRYGDS